jgi:hypothetical protein
VQRHKTFALSFNLLGNVSGKTSKGRQCLNTVHVHSCAHLTEYLLLVWWLNFPICGQQTPRMAARVLSLSAVFFVVDYVLHLQSLVVIKGPEMQHSVLEMTRIITFWNLAHLMKNILFINLLLVSVLQPFSGRS